MKKQAKKFFPDVPQIVCENDCPPGSLMDKVNRRAYGGRVFYFAEGDFVVPSEFFKAKPLPDDPPDAVIFEKDTQEATCTLMFFPLDPSEAMPFDDQAGVIASLHHFLGENQGLIEVRNGMTASRTPFVFTIVKSLKQPAGVQYALTLQLDLGNTVLNLQGYFDEEGATGARDTAIYEYAMRNGIITDQDQSNWCADPYSPDFRSGALMNLSEREDYDEAFPGHPLSELRRFVKFFLEKN